LKSILLKFLKQFFFLCHI